eukprot:Rmarinus@m.27470
MATLQYNNSSAENMKGFLRCSQCKHICTEWKIFSCTRAFCNCRECIVAFQPSSRCALCDLDMDSSAVKAPADLSNFMSPNASVLEPAQQQCGRISPTASPSPVSALAPETPATTTTTIAPEVANIAPEQPQQAKGSRGQNGASGSRASCVEPCCTAQIGDELHSERSEPLPPSSSDLESHLGDCERCRLDSSSSSRIFEATKEGSERCVHFILNTNPSLLDQLNEYGHTLTHIAAREGHYRLVRYFLETRKCQSHVGRDTNDGDTLMHLAARGGCEDTIRYLMDSVPECRRMVARRNQKGGDTVFHVAAFKGRVGAMKVLLEYAEARPLITSVNLHGYTVMHSAATHGHLHAFLWLFEKYSTHSEFMGAVARSGFTFLDCAASYNHLELVEHVLERMGQEQDLEQLLYAGKFGSLFLSALSGGSVDTARCILEHWPNLLSLRSKTGDTALHVAACSGVVAGVEFILHEKHQDEFLFQENDKGYLPIHCAARFGTLGVVQYLVEFDGSSVHRLNQSNQTPFEVARLGKNRKLVLSYLRENQE